MNLNLVGMRCGLRCCAVLGLVVVLPGCAGDGEGASNRVDDVNAPGSGGGSSGEMGTGGAGTGGALTPGVPGSGGAAGPGTGGGTASGGAVGSGGGSNNGPVFDCSTITDTPPEPTILSGPKGTRSIAFDADGLMITGTGQGVFRSTRDTTQVLVPGIQASTGQMRTMKNGDFLLTTLGKLERITPQGAVSSFHASYGHYALRIGPDGMVYGTEHSLDSSSIVRIDPATGIAEDFIELKRGTDPYNTVRAFDFSPEFDAVYIGTEGHFTWKVELDGDMNPVGEPQEFVNLDGVKGAVPWVCGEGTCKVEALGVDVCGNVYASLLYAAAIVRISPDGSKIVPIFAPADNSFFAHEMSWGPTAGDQFKHDSLYLALPFYDHPQLGKETVAELDIGVPYRDWQGTVINR